MPKPTVHSAVSKTYRVFEMSVRLFSSYITVWKNVTRY